MLATTKIVSEQSRAKKLLLAFVMMLLIAAFVVSVVWLALWISTANAKPANQICEVWLHTKPNESHVYKDGELK